jgi:hypothetical protein
LGRALTADAVSDVAAELGVCVRPVLRRVTDRETGAMEQVTLPSSAAMTMDPYGHLIDHNLWASAERIGGTKTTSGRETAKPQVRFWA